MVWFCGGKEQVLSRPWNVAVVLAHEVPATSIKVGVLPIITARHAPGKTAWMTAPGDGFRQRASLYPARVIWNAGLLATRVVLATVLHTIDTNSTQVRQRRDSGADTMETNWGALRLEGAGLVDKR